MKVASADLYEPLLAISQLQNLDIVNVPVPTFSPDDEWLD